MRENLMHILIIDDHSLLRDSVALLLQQYYNHPIIIQHASSAREALQHTLEQQPALILLDIGLPDLRGDEIIGQLLISAPMARIVILSAFDNPTMIQHCMNEGAHGFIPKTASSQHVIAAIDHVMQGHLYTPTPPSEPSYNSQEREILLSKRQKEVLQQVRLGLSNQHIADTLNISLPTVKTHLRNIMDMLNVKNRTQAVNEALLLNLLH